LKRSQEPKRKRPNLIDGIVLRKIIPNDTWALLKKAFYRLGKNAVQSIRISVKYSNPRTTGPTGSDSTTIFDEALHTFLREEPFCQSGKLPKKFFVWQVQASW
jgi:hypothetical protein